VLNRGVTEHEALEVVTGPIEDRPGNDDARVAIGRTAAGRYLRVSAV